MEVFATQDTASDYEKAIASLNDEQIAVFWRNLPNLTIEGEAEKFVTDLGTMLELLADMRDIQLD